ncbi:hypothetical protein V8C86DRAFT_2617245, partial [Haematococcus lacustris]
LARLGDEEGGVPGLLMDLAGLALPSSLTASQQARAGSIRGPGEGKRGRRGGGVGAVEELQEAARAASLHLVGVYGDMRTSLGMQALTALALLGTLPGGCAAALAAPAAPTALPPLLTCRAQDAQQAAAALVSVLAHAGTPAQRATLVGWPGLLPGLTEAAGAASAATAAFASVALADLALEPECAATVAAPGTLSALLALLAAPLALLSEISNPLTNCAPEHTDDEHRGSLSQSSIPSPGNPSRQPVTLAGSLAELLLPSQPFQGSLCFSSLARLPSLDRGSDSSRASPGTSPSAAPLAYLVYDTPKAAVRLPGRGVVEGSGCAALTPPPPRFGRSTLTGASPPSPASYQQRSPTLTLTPLPSTPLLPSLGAGAASPAQGGSDAVSGGCHKDQDGNMAQTKRGPLKLPALSAAVGLTEAPVVGDPRSPNPAAAEGVALGATPMLPQASALPRPSPPPLAPAARPAEGAEAGDTGRRDSTTDWPAGAGVRAGQQSVEGLAQGQAEAKGLAQAPEAPEVPTVSAAFSQSLAVSLAGAMGAAGTFQNLAAAPDLAAALLDLGLLPLVQELLAAVQSMGQVAAPPGLPMEVLDTARGLELLLLGVVANLAACGPDTVTALLAPPHQPLAALLVEALCRCGQHQASARALDCSAPSAHAHPQPDKLSLSGVQLLAVPGPPPPPPPKEAKGTAPAAAAAAAAVAGQWEEVGSSVAGNVQNAASPSLHTGMRESTLGMAPTGVVERAGPGARVSEADSQFSGHGLQQLTALALGALYNLLSVAVPEPSSFHASGPGPAHSSLTLPVLSHTLLSNAPGFAALTAQASHPTQLTPGQLPWPAEGHLYGQARPAASNPGMQRLPETPPSSVPGRDDPSVAAVSLTSLNSIAPPSLVSLMDALQSDDFDDAPNHAALPAMSLRDEENAEATVGEGVSTRSNDVVVCAGQVAWKPPVYLVARQRALLALMWQDSRASTALEAVLAQPNRRAWDAHVDVCVRHVRHMAWWLLARMDDHNVEPGQQL